MSASLSHAAPWLFAFVLIYVSIVLWVARHVRDDGDLINFMMKLNLHQMFTLRGLLVSAIGFLILGLALWSMPS